MSKSMSKFSSEKLIESIKTEIKAITSDRSKLINLDNGKLVDQVEDGYLYTFKAEMRSNIPPESPIFFYPAGEKRLSGTLISQNDFDILLHLAENIGESIPKAKISVDLSYILKSLAEKIGSDEEKSDDSIEEEFFKDQPKKIQFDESCLQKTFSVLDELGFNRNSSQEAAIKECLANSIHFVWGPPGTGKTTNLAQLAMAIAYQSEKLLIISHANAAVDAATMKVAEVFKGSKELKEGRILRIGIPQMPEVRKMEEVSALGALKIHYPNLIRDIDQLETERAEIASTYSKGGSKNEALRERLKEIRMRLSTLRQKIKEAETVLIEDASIILATSSKFAIDSRIWNFGKDNIIVDETSMMGFPFVYAAAKKAEKRLLLFGDFRQLPPVCISDDPLVLNWLGRDAFDLAGVKQRIDHSIPEPRVSLLDTQYRMHEAIGSIVSKFAYEGRLTTDSHSSTAVSNLANATPCPGSSIAIVDTTSLYSACIKEKRLDSYSRINPIQAILSLELAKEIRKNGTKDIAIITPYKAQARLIYGLSKSFDLGKYVSIATIHRFQGAEKAAVIFDLVDSLPMPKASMLTGAEPEISRRLINVAISRCKGKLLVMADKSFLYTHHSGRSPALKLVQLMKDYPSYVPNGLEGVPSEIEWFKNWAAAQVDLFKFLNSVSSVQANLPPEFTPGVQVKRLLDSKSNKISKSTGYSSAGISPEQFLIITSENKIILGGRSPDGPVVFVSGKAQEEIRRAIIEDFHFASSKAD